MAGVGNFLGGLVQGAGAGLEMYGRYKGMQRADAAEGRAVDASKRDAEFYKRMGALLDKWGTPEPGGEAPGVQVDQANVQGAPLVTVPQAGLTPPRQAPQAGYSPTPGSGVGLDTQPLVPMVTRSPKTAVRPPFTSGLGY